MADNQESLQAEYNTLKSRIESFSTQNTDTIQDNIQEDTSAMRLPSVAPSSSLNGKTQEPKVATPEYCLGQRNKLSSFITQVTMVITLQPTRIPSEISKVLYAVSFLRDTAFFWFQPYVTIEP